MNENFLEKQSHTIPAVVSALMLLGALGQWPYGYYQLLRFVVCGVGGYIAFVVFQWKELWAMWLFGFIAVLFNPLIPIHLPREIWRLIDIACALLFATVAVSKGRRKHSSDSDSYEAGKSSHQLVDWAAVTLFLLGSTLGAWGTYHIGFNLLGKEKWDTIGVAILVSMLIGVFFIYVYACFMERKEQAVSGDESSEDKVSESTQKMLITKQKVPRAEEVFKNLAKGDKQTKEDIILLRRFLGYPEDLLSVGLDDMEAYHKRQQDRKRNSNSQ